MCCVSDGVMVVRGAIDGIGWGISDIVNWR